MFFHIDALSLLTSSVSRDFDSTANVVSEIVDIFPDPVSFLKASVLTRYRC